MRQPAQQTTLATSLSAVLLTAAAMTAFAANSLLAKAALDGGMDPGLYTVIRLGSGAFLLVMIAGRGERRILGDADLRSAGALLVYAACFSFAYVRLGAAVGAIVLFGIVQITMVGWGAMRREAPTMRELCGLAVAFVALVYLVLPGVGAPDPFGTALMVASGVAWAVYSLRGRGHGDPLGRTAGSFALASVASLPLLLLPGESWTSSLNGVVLAVVSGAVTSGLGYVIWYAALNHLTATRAAVVQLTVPVIAGVGAVVLLAEPVTARLAIAGAGVIGGVWLTLSTKASKG